MALGGTKFGQSEDWSPEIRNHPRFDIIQQLMSAQGGQAQQPQAQQAPQTAPNAFDINDHYARAAALKAKLGA